MFRAATEWALEERLPLVYLAANSGARVGLAAEVKQSLRVGGAVGGEGGGRGGREAGQGTPRISASAFALRPSPRRCRCVAAGGVAEPG
jgi:hypothetical protein